MKQLFLTSSVHAVAHDLVQRVDLTRGNRLAFITTAAEPETGDLSWLQNDRQSLVDAGFAVTDYTITGKSAPEIKSDLAEFSFLYFSGGNTFHLLTQSLKSGFLPVIKHLIEEAGKTYIGTSAGSIIAGQRCPDYLLDDPEVANTDQATGYGLVNFTILPHWGSKDFHDLYLGGRMEIAYKRDQVPLLLLTDSQYVWVQGESLQLIDTYRR